MKRNINHIIAAMGMALGVLSLSSCIEETYPNNQAVPGQISSSSKRWNILPTVFLLSSPPGIPTAVATIPRTGAILARCTCATCSARTSR